MNMNPDTNNLEEESMNFRRKIFINQFIFFIIIIIKLPFSWMISRLSR